MNKKRVLIRESPILSRKPTREVTTAATKNPNNSFFSPNSTGLNFGFNDNRTSIESVKFCTPSINLRKKFRLPKNIHCYTPVATGNVTNLI